MDIKVDSSEEEETSVEEVTKAEEEAISSQESVTTVASMVTRHLPVPMTRRQKQWEKLL